MLGIAASGPGTAAVPPSFDDATLRAVQFVDRSEGWAVGDLGVIWHTMDGGKTWERQPSGTKASLRGVKFLTPYTGWVVGRVELPNGAGSAGVVLATADGGASWKELTSTTLPGLNAVQFFDENRGVVAGDGTDVFPTGVFKTADGGRTWAQCPGPRVDTWHAMVCLDADTGLFAGGHSLAVMRQGKIAFRSFQGLDAYGLRTLIRSGEQIIGLDPDMSDAPRRIAFGPEGLDTRTLFNFSKTTSNSGFVLRSASAVGDRTWACGRPGAVLHNSEPNGPWEFQKTNTPAPLHAIQMLDITTGWAVGELGTILGTTDGGKTWAVQKAGGQRAAVLFAHARPEGVPLGAVAALGGKDGYLCAAVCLSQTDEPRLAAAMRVAGGAAGECDGSIRWPGFMTEPTPGGSPELLQAAKDPAILARLVLALRTWRPEVVVTDLLSPEASPAEQLTLLHMKEAFTLAADPAAFPEQIDKLGLAPHAAKKLYAVAPGPDGAVTLDLTTFVPELGEALKHAAEPAALLLGTTVPDQVHFRLIAHRLPGAQEHTGLMQGVELAEGGTARRRKPVLNPEAGPLVAELQKAADLRRKLDRETSLPVLVAGIQQLPADMAARAGVSLGRKLADAGRWSEAREVFALVAEKYPLFAESVEAVRWLVRYHSSGEVRRRIELGHFPVLQTAAFAPADDGAVKQVMYSEPVAAKPTYRFSSPEALQQWHRAGLDLEPKLAAFGAVYALDPGTNLCLHAARRNLGLFQDAGRRLQALLPSAPTADGWTGRLADELRLITTAEPKLTKTADCRFTTTKPYLDGKLDDECWKAGADITTPDGIVPRPGRGAHFETSARFAHDDQFLYVGVTCSHPEGKQVPKAEKRSRDEDLRGHDRIELLLDLDRDYQTYYRLRVDHRGCVAEDCWGDVTWNPRWFVAVDSTPTGWTAELAIPLAELTGTAPAANQFWGMNVVRVVPGVGVDSWGGPSDATPRPAAMGLMRFVK
jgi:photosystem II stability/assembly factor-like uncharacterized protein